MGSLDALFKLVAATVGALAACSGCGRVGFGESDQGVARCDWRTTPALEAPVAMPFETEDTASDPTLSSDFLELYFYVSIGESTRIHRATRPSRELPFGPREIVPGLDQATARTTGFFLHSDGLTAYYSQSVGTHHDLFQVTRAARDLPFEDPAPLGELNTAGHEFNPRLSPDGLTLIFVRWTDVAPTSAENFLARRTSVDQPWQQVERASYSTPEADAAAGFIDDHRTVIFESAGDLFVARQPTTGDAYRVEPLAALNTPFYDGIPFPSSDGCELWLVTDRPGRSGVYDIMYTRVVDAVIESM